MADISFPYGARFENAVFPRVIEEAVRELNLGFCDISGFGTFTSATLTEDDAEKATLVEGPLQVIQLTGRIRRVGGIVISDYSATFCRQTPEGLQLIAGRPGHADISLLEVTITPLRTLEKVHDGKTAVTPVSPPVSSDASVDDNRDTVPFMDRDQWAMALEESRKLARLARAERLNEDDPPIPAIGDVVRHRQFGDCKVVKLTDDHILLKKPNGRIVQLGLQVLRFEEVAKENRTTFWDVRIGR